MARVREFARCPACGSSKHLSVFERPELPELLRVWSESRPGHQGRLWFSGPLALSTARVLRRRLTAALANLEVAIAEAEGAE